MATAAKFRIDVAIHDLLVNSAQRPPTPAQAKGLSLPEPVFPQFPERLNNPGPETPPERRKWGAKDVYRYSRGWLAPDPPPGPTAPSRQRCRRRPPRLRTCVGCAAYSVSLY